MYTDLIYKLEANGFRVKKQRYVEKYSQHSKRFEIAGEINSAGVYFYAQNVDPFKPGQNTIKSIFGSNTHVKHFAPVQKSKEEIERKFTFEEYKKTTQSKSQFSIYANRISKKLLNKPFKNSYDIRGIKEGFYKDATLFPYFDYEGNFQTAKIVKYNSNTGKRLKENYSNSWFHSEKNIKAELGIKGKIHKSIDCFFGEHLIPFNDNPIVIVEAEKTAILLSLIYKETVFIATGGLAKLKNLDWSFLVNREVFVFPDHNAKQWFEIANNRGWWVSDIIENKGKPGEDIADYLTDYDNEEKTQIWWEIHEQLWNINERNISSKKIECVSLNFEHKSKLSFNYCLPILKEFEINHYWDNSKGKFFKGKHFLIFNKKFNCLNANIDFNKVYFTEFGWQQMNVDQFLKKLKKVFIIVKYLNEDKDHLKIFSKILQNIFENSNHTFNIQYIERAILPIWDKQNIDIEDYFKRRNWRFNSEEKIEKAEFVSMLNNDQKLYKTHKYLKALLPFFNVREYILPEYIGLHSKRSNSFVWELINQYNKSVLGCSSYQNYKSKLRVSEYLKSQIKTDKNSECVQMFATTYYNDSIYWQGNVHTFKIPSLRSIISGANVGRNIIKEYFEFKPNEEEIKELMNTIKYYIDNPQSFDFNRVNGRIEIIAKPMEIENKNILPLIDSKKAFDYDQDLTQSVLNISKSEALNHSADFLASWILFHNPHLTELEREQIKFDPISFFKENIIPEAVGFY